MENKTGLKPVNGNILVYIPEVSDTTKAGILKSQAIIEEEKRNMDKFVIVAAVADDIEGIKINDKLLVGLTNIPIIELNGNKFGIIHKLNVIAIKQ